MWVLGVMYSESENLRRLDQVLITNREFNDVIVWTERLMGKRSKMSLKKLTDTLKNVKKPPALKVDDDNKQANTA